MQLRSVTRDNLGNLDRCPPASCIHGVGADRGPDAFLSSIVSADAAEINGATGFLWDPEPDWSQLSDLNRRPTVYKTVALPLS